MLLTSLKRFALSLHNIPNLLAFFGFFAVALLVGCASSNPKIEKPFSNLLLQATPKPEMKRSVHEARSRKFMITSQGEASTQAGAEMFRQGGNAIDAAVAVSFAISVERPQSTGIGGGGFMLVHFAKTKETIALDFREKAPLAASRNMYLDKKGDTLPKLSLDGALSVGVPGLVAGLKEAHRKYGKLPWSKVIAPAIRLAEEGITVYPHLEKAIKHREAVLRQFPDSRKLFFRPDGTPLQVGDQLKQPDLAKTLRTIQARGKDGFYQGWVARAIVQSQEKHGGLITLKDLATYNVKVREPLRADYNGYQVVSMPPPSSGGVHVLQILNILENVDLKSLGPFSPQAIHYTASAMQQAFADRATYLGDSDFVEVPVKELISQEYANHLFKQINSELARPSSEVKAGNPKLPYESDETTHFTVMDAKGNTVSSTQTINYYFGSGVVAEGTGIVLNDEMDDFSAKPGALNVFGAVGSDKNAIEPNKRPLSSMSPTIVFEKDKPILALGTPSGTRIITCVASTLLNYLTYDMPLFDAVASLRYHHQWIPDEIRVDAPGFPDRLDDALRERGFHVHTKPLSCRINAIATHGSELHGVADPRGEGMSLGK